MLKWTKTITVDRLLSNAGLNPRQKRRPRSIICRQRWAVVQGSSTAPFTSLSYHKLRTERCSRIRVGMHMQDWRAAQIPESRIDTGIPNSNVGAILKLTSRKLKKKRVSSGLLYEPEARWRLKTWPWRRRVKLALCIRREATCVPSTLVQSQGRKHELRWMLRQGLTQLITNCKSGHCPATMTATKPRPKPRQSSTARRS